LNRTPPSKEGQIEHRGTTRGKASECEGRNDLQRKYKKRSSYQLIRFISFPYQSALPAGANAGYPKTRGLV
jgi:hypothetical protein